MALIDEPILRQTGTDTLLYYHHNQQLSSVALTGSNGFVAERHAYTAYGQPSILNPSGSFQAWSTYSIRHTYTGREWDNTLGMFYFRTRWLEPNLGRFTGRDPLQFVDGTNTYRAYFQTGALDPTGTLVVLVPVWVCVAAGTTTFTASATAGYCAVVEVGPVVCEWWWPEVLPKPEPRVPPVDPWRRSICPCELLGSSTNVAAYNLRNLASEGWPNLPPEKLAFKNHFFAALFERRHGLKAHDDYIRRFNPSYKGGKSHLNEFAGCSGLRDKVSRLDEMLAACRIRGDIIPPICQSAISNGSWVLDNICDPLGL